MNHILDECSTALNSQLIISTAAHKKQKNDDNEKQILIDFQKEMEYLQKLSPTHYRINIGFVPNMKVPADIIVNDELEELLVMELKEAMDAKKSSSSRGGGSNPSFIPALKQMANVAALPGIVRCLAMPDVHSGYGFCIGNVAAFDMDDEMSVISPGGVGFDINCGVRLIRTNLTEDDVQAGEKREELVQTLFDFLPVGVGVDGEIPATEEDIDEILRTGIDWAIEKGFAWSQDKDHCEENGRMESANPDKVSKRAKKRGLHQLGTLGCVTINNDQFLLVT